VYFLSIVFLGAFFLINLTLAVINASFTKSQKGGGETELNDDVDEIGEIEINDDKVKTLGISQFFIAKRAAKKMIEFLRLR
jgi:hypothetical protein